MVKHTGEFFECILRGWRLKDYVPQKEKLTLFFLWKILMRELGTIDSDKTPEYFKNFETPSRHRFVLF